MKSREIYKTVKYGKIDVRYIIHDGKLFVSISDVARATHMTMNAVHSQYLKVSPSNKLSIASLYPGMTFPFKKCFSLEGLNEITTDAHFATQEEYRNLITFLKGYDPRFAYKPKKLDKDELIDMMTEPVPFTRKEEDSAFDDFEEDFDEEEDEVVEEEVKAPVEKETITPKRIERPTVSDSKALTSIIANYSKMISDMKEAVMKLCPDIVFGPDNMPIKIGGVEVEEVVEEEVKTPTKKETIVQKPVVEHPIISTDRDRFHRVDPLFTKMGEIDSVEIENIGYVRYIIRDNKYMVMVSDVFKAAGGFKSSFERLKERVGSEMFMYDKKMLLYESSHNIPSTPCFISLQGFEIIGYTTRNKVLRRFILNELLPTFYYESKGDKLMV